MSADRIALLGAIAGFTIFIGLPVGRLRNPMPRLRAALNAVGILIFLLWDVLEHAWAPTDEAFSHHHYGDAAANGGVLIVGLAALVYFQVGHQPLGRACRVAPRRARRRRRPSGPRAKPFHGR
jgi:ZIP family zinc transporter